MTIGQLAALVLGVYRVTRMVVKEDGPGDVFVTLRTAVSEQWPGQWPEDGINCPYCVSVWAALVLALAVRPGSILGWVLMALAGSAGASTLYRVLDEE